MDDSYGNRIYTGDKINLTGCSSTTAYIGLNDKNIFMIYFGCKDGVSVGWDLKGTIERGNEIKVID